jgi:hypothetical protein
MISVKSTLGWRPLYFEFISSENRYIVNERNNGVTTEVMFIEMLKDLLCQIRRANNLNLGVRRLPISRTLTIRTCSMYEIVGVARSAKVANLSYESELDGLVSDNVHTLHRKSFHGLNLRQIMFCDSQKDLCSAV